MHNINKCAKLFFFLGCLFVQYVYAGDTDSITKFQNFKISRIVLTGNGYCGFDVHLTNQLIDSSGMASTSIPIGIAPILLWKVTSNLFFESELDVMMDHGMVKAEIGYASISYTLPRLFTIQVGKFLSPFGIFSERYHPFWINNMPDEPLGFIHDGYSPPSELGICLRSGAKHFNWATYLSSSPGIDAGASNVYNAGKILYNAEFGSKPSDKISFGGRIGYARLKKSTLELGFSYKYMQLKPGQHNDGTVTAHTHVDKTLESREYVGHLFAFDLTIQKMLPRLKGIVDLKVQANYTDAGENTFIKLSVSGKTEVPYTFSNTTKLGFLMITYKPIFSKKNLLKNSGIYLRGSLMELPIGSLWYENTKEISGGLTYSFRWNNMLKLGYQQMISAKKNYTNNIMIQWAMGF